MSGGRRPDWLVIARREFLERVRTIWFLAVTALGPIGMIAIIVIPVLLARVNNGATVQIVDHTHALGAPLAEEFGKLGWKTEIVAETTDEPTLLGRIRDGSINGFLTVPSDAISGSGTIVYQGDNATNQLVTIMMWRINQQVVQHARGVAAGVDPAKLEHILTPVAIESKHTTGEASGSSAGAAFVLGYAVMFILYMAIILYAVNVMRSVVMEKTSRVVELMVAAAKPQALMMGKIIGVGAAGLVQIAAWMAMAVITITYRTQILGLFGVAGDGFTLPPLAWTDAVVIVLYFLLGYFFYAALYAALGAMVSSDQEAQQAQLPVTLLLLIPMLSMQVVANDPRGGAAEALTQIPFSSPILMPMRWLLGGSSGLDAAVSLGILAISTVFVTRLAGRIYRVGILMYGKRPSVREILRWLTY
ncbi:MAG: ABC transporter permease [Deltaproteobacteria bacterium]|nr:ABC transporter permease [Deltaproteobacteria bacterium]